MAEREQSMKELQEENLRIQNEHLKEETEYFRERNEQSRARRAERQRMHATQEEALSANRRIDRGVQENCTHMKGGKGDDLVNNQGDGENGGYSVIKHLHAWGEWQVLCRRCKAEWWPGDTEDNHPTGIGFKTAVKWPTDNASSGSAQFRVDPAVVEGMRITRFANRGLGPDGKPFARRPGAVAAA